MPDVTTSYGRFSGLIGFFGYFNVRYAVLHQTLIIVVESFWFEIIQPTFIRHLIYKCLVEMAAILILEDIGTK